MGEHNYVLPGTSSAPGQTALPDDLEQAAVEQVAYWFQNREHLGLKTYWPSDVAYNQFAALDLPQPVTPPCPSTAAGHCEKFTFYVLRFTFHVSLHVSRFTHHPPPLQNPALTGTTTLDYTPASPGTGPHPPARKLKAHYAIVQVLPATSITAAPFPAPAPCCLMRHSLCPGH
ncbi:MAG TPA: hypothetical protein VN578_22040 [Candidatus Binatia bacterium]|nr:hypothetical protein [Candidatus Binatia bacterium]